MAFDETLPIDSISVQSYRIPTATPESDGTFQWEATVMVAVHLSAGGKRGFGYTYADQATAHLIESAFRPSIVGKNAFDIDRIWADLIHLVRNLGRRGIAAMAISAVDAALWDLKAKLLGLPLLALLGRVRPSVPVYGSGGFTSYTIGELQQQLGGWAAEGISRVKMKVGRDAAADQVRVRAAREAIGTECELFVDANGAYSEKVAIAQAMVFAESNVTWFEEPVSSDRLAGLRFIRERVPAPMEITAGEYGYELQYFAEMITAGAVDVLQADATRCCGVTGFIKTSAICEARSMPLSAHTAPSIHAHLGCALLPMRHLEYFFDHARIEGILFDGALVPRDGTLVPDMSRPGFGIELKEADAKRFAI